MMIFRICSFQVIECCLECFGKVLIEWQPYTVYEGKTWSPSHHEFNGHLVFWLLRARNVRREFNSCLQCLLSELFMQQGWVEKCNFCKLGNLKQIILVNVSISSIHTVTVKSLDTHYFFLSQNLVTINGNLKEVQGRRCSYDWLQQLLQCQALFMFSFLVSYLQLQL